MADSYQARKLEIIGLIDKLFGDLSVSPEQTKDSLEEIRDEILIKIEALEADERNEKKVNKEPYPSAGSELEDYEDIVS